MLLEDLSRHIQEVRHSDWTRLALEDLCLDSLFLSVRLNDGSSGAAMNYDLEGVPDLTPAQIDHTRARLLEIRENDPLLWDYLHTRDSQSLAHQALWVAVLSALSAPILTNAGRLQELGLQSQTGRIALRHFQDQGVGKVAIIGFGGYLEEALAQDWLEKVSCCDFLALNEDFQRYNPYPFKIKQDAQKRGLQVVYDDGRNASALLDEADLICLSASTLCNGSLEALLPPEERIVILEGPSAGVLPGPLFELGVTHLVHNPIDIDFVQLCHRFSRQNRQGLQKISSGRFIDILLPEQRTISRLNTP
ncbi:MAG: hypothetical protein KF760_30740 [Candidatus Eremiobacteraeota bacterium]|nr:hypothetical protein [Candidatus Eremiobacteraeota bacterium]MCW5868625.1 hypothetical protein [Candidatus Eremiobacteraeota bacterium]